MPRSLGDFFSDYPFAVEEKRRLAGLAANGGTPAHIVNTYVTRTKGYKGPFRRSERIAGFRPGTRLYHEQALPRLIRYLGTPSHPQHKLCWELYRAAAIDFIKKELASFDKLLRTVRLPDGSPSVAELFELTCRRALDYEVSPEQVLTFYEVWGLPRIDNLETNIRLWMQPDETSLQRRELAKLHFELAAIKNVVKELSSQVTSLAGDFTRDGELAKSDRLQLAHQDEALRFLSTAHEQLSAMLTGSDLRIKALEGRASRLSERVTKAHCDDTSALDLKAEFHRLDLQTQSTLRTTTEALKDELMSLVRNDTAVAAASIEARVTALASDASKKRDELKALSGPFSSTRYRSPLVGMLSHVPPPHKLTGELDFVNSWAHHLAQTWDVLLSIEHALAFHRAFLANQVVIADHALAQSWIDCLAWQSFTLHVAASPTWSSEEDWARGAEHLFACDQGRSPRIVMLHTYDVGLTDCYLSPSLALWALRGEARALAKLFLIPSDAAQFPSPRVLEHAIFCSSAAHLTGISIQLRDGIRAPDPRRRDPPVGVDPKSASQWLQTLAPVDYDLNTFQRALNLQVSNHLVAGFRRTTALASRYLDDASAIRFAMHGQVIPWVQARYGETKSDELRAFLSDLPESGS